MSKTNLASSIESTTLLSTRNAEEVKRVLSLEHGMIMSVNDNKKEVIQMCNLGESIFEDGIEQGIEQGITQVHIDLIKSKLKKGMSITKISELLEQDEGYIKNLIETYHLIS